jgi:hypothetical protein
MEILQFAHRVMDNQNYQYREVRFLEWNSSELRKMLYFCTKVKKKLQVSRVSVSNL